MMLPSEAEPLFAIRPKAISSAGVKVQLCVPVTGSELGRLATAVASSAEVLSFTRAVLMAANV